MTRRAKQLKFQDNFTLVHQKTPQLLGKDELKLYEKLNYYYFL